MPQDVPLHELISLAEASRRYGFSMRYLRDIARSGRLQAWKIGRDYMTTAEAVETYIESRVKKGAYRNDIGS